MNDTEKALESLKNEIEKKEKRTISSFKEFLESVKADPERLLRNIFQLFHDMVKIYVGEGVDEYPDDPESIGYVQYDCSKLFVKGADNSFFADRLFANRFVNQAKSLKQGSQQNQLRSYLGPHGCGKSTFMNNLLRAFEEYTNTKEGQSFETFWEIDEGEGKKLEVPCPSHDHPILIIPKNYRADFLKQLLSGSPEFRDKVFEEKEYEWVLKGEVCTICKSLFWTLFEKLDSFEKVLNMIKVRSFVFDRRLGEGISVFNPGDKPMKELYLTDKQIQERLDQVFGANLVKYAFSRHAKTNNGIYVLMDVKGENKPRLSELHNIITEGVHKVGDMEEQENSLYFALMNPEDKDAIEENKAESFQGRIQYNKFYYVLEVPTEVKIYRSVFGDQIDKNFLPRVLDNFTRVVIASRMNDDCEPLDEWIGGMQKYEKYCDDSGRLLRMEIYSGVIPPWLLEEDRKKFTAKIRKSLIAYGAEEGDCPTEGKEPIDGRESLRLFSKFLSRYDERFDLINMSNVVDFFKHGIGKELRDKYIPKNFIASLVNWYDYTVLNEVKEALFFYNEKRIREDILHYLFAISFDPDGSKVECPYTKKKIELTVDFFRMMATYLTGEEMSEDEALDYAKDIQQKYTKMMARDPEKKITETELYQELFNSYVKNLKDKALQPFIDNESFRDAIKAYPDGKEFKAADSRLKEHIAHMIKNLTKSKFGYTEQGAKEICLYVIDQKLAEKFAD